MYWFRCHLEVTNSTKNGVRQRACCQSMDRTYIPSGSTIISLGHIVIPFSMTTHEQHLVLYICRALTIQSRDFIGKSLPLSLLIVRIKGLVA